MARKTGKKFNDETANDIFDKLKNVEGKVKSKRKGRFDDITYMIMDAERLKNDGKYEEAVNLYREVLYILPDSSKAYEALADIYNVTGDSKNEKEVLKEAIRNCSQNKDFKERLNRLNV